MYETLATQTFRRFIQILLTVGMLAIRTAQKHTYDNIQNKWLIEFIICSAGGPSAPPVYTIDVNSNTNSTPTNYTNAAYVITENSKTRRTNDGLPTYEEAMAGITHSIGPQCTITPPSTTIPIELPVDEMAAVAIAAPKRGRRHRHHQRHNRRPRCDAVPAGPAADQPNATFSAMCEYGTAQPGDDAPTHGRRGRRNNYRHLRNQRRGHHRDNAPQNQ